MNFDEYLKNNQYRWIDIVRLSIQHNVSIKTMINKLIEQGMEYIDNHNRKNLVKYIDNKLWELL